MEISCLLGPAAGAAVICIVLWQTGGLRTKKVLLTDWMILTTFGFVTMFASDELGLRRTTLSEPAAACIFGTIYVGVVLGVIGWHVASGNSTHTSEINETLVTAET